MKMRNLERFRTGGSGHNMQLGIPLPRTPDGRVYRYSPNEDAHPRHFVLGDVLAEVTRTAELSARMKRDLRAFSDAFVDWRYVFEGAGQQVRVNLLAAFVQSTYVTVRTRCPDWPVRPDQDARLQHQPATLSMTVANLGGGTFLHMLDGTPGAQLNTPDA